MNFDPPLQWVDNLSTVRGGGGGGGEFSIFFQVLDDVEIPPRRPKNKVQRLPRQLRTSFRQPAATKIQRIT